MGLFDKLFGKDPDKELDRAEALLGEGDAEKALKIAQKVEKANPHLGRAQKTVEKIQDHLAKSFLEMVARSEANGSYANALEWLEIAMKYVHENGARATLEERMRVLKEKAADENEQESDLTPAPAPAAKAEPEQEVHHELDPEIHYHTLINMLEPTHAERYENRPEAFVNAFLALNGTTVDEASDALDELLLQAPGDPVYLLERARCALIVNDPEKARDCVEKAWPALGDEDLDLAGSLSAPGLWADAMLRLEKPAAVAERLEPLADPTLGREMLCLYYGRALEGANRPEEAAEHFRRSAVKFERNPWFVLHLADLLEQLGDWQKALQRLEKFIAPSCASGYCGVPKHLPSIRRLARMYLDHRVQPQRAKELLNHVAHSLHGNLTREDFVLLAAYHTLVGNAEAAEEATAMAQEAQEASASAQAATPAVETGQKAVL